MTVEDVMVDVATVVVSMVGEASARGMRPAWRFLSPAADAGVTVTVRVSVVVEVTTGVVVVVKVTVGVYVTVACGPAVMENER